uniref:Uncharacterized protein n=1 Tax=Chromera velia CCMP2878 TaxID=1169474 RepID=A0A0G4I3G3_9ALVE|eukprot:Cvel_10674.t1-p1 / transcript=Cvel_10674.t1 / gene=Cvel_10674 / organism=Chromera_velia_CCMP2878 / gene_product=hypothetical protein / transcript_product=hypothetical protein / location=Cvel_scaffold649:8560-9945(+) / protein_length=462 / sequence_SO=supercontig / SO=protein_coding / is_pseudo=false
MRQQRDPYERISRTPLPDVLKKRSAKKDFRATPDGVEVPVAAYLITYWVVGGWIASELADIDHCQQGPFLTVRKFDTGGADHFKPWDYGFERTHLAAFSAVMVDQQREVMALHARYGHQNFDDLKETLTAEGIDVDEDCRRWVSACSLYQLKNTISPRIHKRSEKLSADWRLIKGTVWIVNIWFFKDLLAKAETGGFGMMVVLYEPGAGFFLAYPAKKKDEASLIDCAHYFARWLGHPHLVCMNGEKAGAGASFQSWLRGDGSPGLHPIEYRQGPPYVGKGLQALVERCIRSNRGGVALFISDPNHRFPLAVIHLVAMGERSGYSCAFHRTVGGIPFTLTFRRAPPGWRVGDTDTAVVSIPGNGVVRSHCAVFSSAHTRCCRGSPQVQGERRSRGTFYRPSGPLGASVDGPGQPPPLVGASFRSGRNYPPGSSGRRTGGSSTLESLCKARGGHRRSLPPTGR